MRARWLHVVVVIGVVLSLAVPASAQFPRSQRPLTTVETGPAGRERTREPRLAPITLTPSVTVTEEFDDNVRFNNDVRRWDLITTVSPALTLSAERPTWRVSATYDFVTRLFARDTDRSSGFDTQDFALDSLYRLSPTTDLFLTDSFTFNTGINAFAPQGVVTGRDRFWSNSVRLGGSTRLDPLTTVRGSGGVNVQRFSREGLRDSDIWTGIASAERVFTPRLRGTLGYDVSFFNIETTPDVTTHTPRAGVTYDFTPTLSGTVSGGPSFEVRDGGGDRVTPAVAASLAQRYQWGGVTLTYDRAVGTAGGLGGTTDNQVAGVSIAYTTLTRGLTIEFAPQYRTFKTDDAAIGRIDVTSYTIPLQLTYQITPWFGFTAGYSFLQQRASTNVLSTTDASRLGNDVDQNRVFIGAQVGYPIRFD